MTASTPPIINIRGDSYRLKDHRQALGLATEDAARAVQKKGGTATR